MTKVVRFRRRKINQFNDEMLERFGILDASEYLFEDIVEELHDYGILEDLINRYANYGIFKSEIYNILELKFFSLSKASCLRLLDVYMHKKNYAWKCNYNSTDALNFSPLGYIGNYEDEY